MNNLLYFLLFFLPAVSYAQTSPAAADSKKPPEPADKYNRSEIMIPMRDGIRLHTVVFTPKIPQEKLPILFSRTPYGVNMYVSPEKNTYVKDMAVDGYIFVYQDIRGKHLSEGKFEMQRLGRNKKDPKAIDESSDTYDTIEWLLKNIASNNGRIGMYGASYDAWLAMVAAADPHLALKAISSQASPADMFLGDDFHHNGAFRLSYGFEYAFQEEASKTDSAFQFDKYDTYDWYLNLGALSNVNKKYFNGKIATWNNFSQHPNYDDFWQKQSLFFRLDSPRVAIQHVGGWFDQEDLAGPQVAYKFLERNDKSNKNYLIIGPWKHGIWAGGNGNQLGNIKFKEMTAPQFRTQMQAPWFAYHLKGIGDGKFAEATTFQTGANKWMNYNSWPPKAAAPKNIYLQANGALSFLLPKAAETNPKTEFISDPERPVPYRRRPIEATYSPTSRWYNWLAEDQRFVHNRPDVLSFQTEVLSQDVTVTGDLLAKIYAATTGSDADWVVKLIDVYPDVYPEEPILGGNQFMVAGEVFRGRFRKSFSKPEAITPNQVELYTIDLHGINHVFKKGHKIMVQVQSTWFPVIDRNPQTFVPNIFEAKESDFKKATHKIYHSVKFPSHIILPVML